MRHAALAAALLALALTTSAAPAGPPPTASAHLADLSRRYLDGLFRAKRRSPM